MVNDLNRVRELFMKDIEDTGETLRQMQSTPPGTRPRSKRETTNLVKRINALPPDIRLEFMERVMNGGTDNA